MADLPLKSLAKKLPDRYRVPLQRLYRYGTSMANRFAKKSDDHPARFSVFPPPKEISSTDWPERLQSSWFICRPS